MTRAPAVRVALALVASVMLSAQPCPAATHSRKAEKAAAAPASPPPPAAASPDDRPYDPQLLRLAEVLGALTTMRQLCGAPDADQWRRRMQALLDAEGNPPARKDRLAGAFNRGLRGYGLTYRTCTSNARLVIRRFLDESSRLARDIGNRYRAT